MPEACQFIRACVADPATAEDILQDVFVKLQNRLHELHDPAKLQGWLFLVARNAIIDHYRTRKKTSELTESLTGELPETDAESEELKVMFHRPIFSRAVGSQLCPKGLLPTVRKCKDDCKADARTGSVAAAGRAQPHH